MIDLLQARELANAELRQMEIRYHRSPGSFALHDQHTIKRAWGWVFFYNSHEFVETGDMKYALGGNSPLFVNGSTAEVHHTESCLSLDANLAAYEKHLEEKRGGS